MSDSPEIRYALTAWEVKVLATEQAYMADRIPRMRPEEFAVYLLRAEIYRLYESYEAQLPGWMPASRPPLGVDVESAALRRMRRGRRARLR